MKRQVEEGGLLGKSYSLETKREILSTWVNVLIISKIVRKRE